ncbi:hypothetical protein [Phenylobacterium sp.]|uniref:hypothetical protein n=1 Tax=Phenylobacterium sp. TaxID=1871053 RepID=UPI003983BE73
MAVVVASPGPLPLDGQFNVVAARTSFADAFEIERESMAKRPLSDLGASIVEALAKQSHAVVAVAPGRPGAHVSITHTQIAVVGRGPALGSDEAPATRPAAEHRN